MKYPHLSSASSCKLYVVTALVMYAMAGVKVREVSSVDCCVSLTKNAVLQQLLCPHYFVSAHRHCICHRTHPKDSMGSLSGKAFPGEVPWHFPNNSMGVRRSLWGRIFVQYHDIFTHSAVIPWDLLPHTCTVTEILFM